MADEELNLLHRRLLRADQRHAERLITFDGERQFYWGYETRRKEDNYYFDGRKHSAASNRSRILFQYSLEGRGEYTEGGKRWTLEPGVGLTVLLPDAYEYYLPKGSGHWTFFWFIVQHPFVCERIRKLRRKEAAVQAWSPGFPALEAAALLFESSCEGKLREVWALEERLFSWLLETERELYHRRYPQDERQQLLDETRRLLRERLPKPPSAAELADIHHLERTTFSRKFKATTGISPAAFVMEVRLEEALKLLRTEATLKDVATSTGFADTNHFCKVFRRYFHSSPGAYRILTRHLS